jgi:predicted O-methyltransferase YrrM
MWKLRLPSSTAEAAVVSAVLNVRPGDEAWPEATYTQAPLSERSAAPGVDAWYHPALLTAGMIGDRSMETSTIRAVLDIYDRLEPDAYLDTLRIYYSRGLDVYGSAWRYSDLVTGLYAASELIKPRAYLEIGVRRGRSMAAVASVSPGCALVGFDRWTPNYAGMQNPGAQFVVQEMHRLGHSGPLELISGNSHETVPRYFEEHPDAWFDLIAVDGDHSPRGAAEDLACVLPRLKVGGAVLFDDITHPKHLDLADVWARACGQDPRFSHWEYGDLGYGLGIAVRKY